MIDLHGVPVEGRDYEIIKSLAQIIFMQTPATKHFMRTLATKEEKAARTWAAKQAVEILSRIRRGVKSAARAGIL